MRTLVIFISHCSDCPFRVDRVTCMHPASVRSNGPGYGSVGRTIGEAEPGTLRQFPEWCPLKDISVSVEIPSGLKEELDDRTT